MLFCEECEQFYFCEYAIMGETCVYTHKECNEDIDEGCCETYDYDDEEDDY